MKLSRQHSSLILLLIFYSVGILGLTVDQSRESFLRLTPFNLMLTAGIFIWGQGKIRARLLFIMLMTAILGFLVEVIGVQTGILFGQYSYGPVLGWKLMDVPLIIGVNWSILVLSAGGLVRDMASKPLVRALLAAFLITSLDVLIEPVAIVFDFWTWAGHEVPLQNYAMWFVVALLMEILVERSDLKPDKKVSAAVFFVQVGFFGLLNLLI